MSYLVRSLVITFTLIGGVSAYAASPALPDVVVTTAGADVVAAAESGDAAAQSTLGWLYEAGWGEVPQSYQQALVWYTKAAEQGSFSAQLKLGNIYEAFGHEGAPENYKLAVIWYRKAADQGNSAGQDYLGRMYHGGYGVPQNYKQAQLWFRKAAEQGLPSAQSSLGLMYSHGQGAPQDNVQAYTWLSVAATNGQIDAAKKRDIIAERLSPAQLNEAQEQAARYFEDYQPN